MVGEVRGVWSNLIVAEPRVFAHANPQADARGYNPVPLGRGTGL